VDDGRTPVWEQELSAGALCYNLLLAANASGWAGVWLSEWPAYDVDAGVLLGVKQGERVAGFVHIGTARVSTPERVRADVRERITRWSMD
jgi:nitroreductase